MLGNLAHTMTMAGEYLSTGEAAELLGVHPDTLRRWERAGRVKAVRTPTGQRRFKRADIEALLHDDDEDK